jgi:hypothetical protein
MKQTAVEWLEAHLIEYGFDLSLHKFEIKQAKEMEKNHIIITYTQGCIDTLKDETKRGEQYYNETFNK